MSDPTASASWVQRSLLPGFALKAMVIGGGYATGRELAEFSLSSGAWGAIAGLLLAMALWRVACMAIFVFTHTDHACDYRSFFKQLRGPLWGLFEFAYLILLIVLLAVLSYLSLAVYVAPLLT